MRGFGNRSLNTNLTPTIFGHHLDHDLFLCKPILRGLEIRQNSLEAIFGATEEMARRTAAVSQHSDLPLNDGFVRESRPCRK